ncbi:heavy-metal-associated domain-containing protein [Sphingomonas lacunae]|uniref:Heavy-metal-associated domain-containing protein n=1 Tax=Sphingomonas lacunae TaxID=2698828 RepID=A0A6M4AZA4_9SPHN|nr:heavy-metal-associated domain-containing protein [Sphingomonas lacunae]
MGLGFPLRYGQKGAVIDIDLLSRHLRQRKPLTWLAAGLALAILGGGVAVVAQIEGDRGIPPVNSSNDLMVTGIQVDVRADSADEAREKGWQEAQRKGWAALFKQVNGGASAPGLPDSTLNGIVSAIVVEREQIGPGRYIATLGVQFDRARAGQILGISGRIFRSPPLLVLPVVYEGGIPQSFEQRSEWQRAWALLRTADSTIDYVRTSGRGADPLLLNPGQMRRRGRIWWRELLDQYGASDVLIPVVRIERMWPGGPLVGYFSARYGPDNELLGSFTLTARSPNGLRAMMVEGVRRIDAIYVGALADGRLRTDPSLIIEEPVDPDEIEQSVEEEESTEAGDAAGTERDAQPQASEVAAARDYSVQVETPDSLAVIAVEAQLRGIGGVESAQTSSMAIGGVSVVRVRYRGDSAALRAALQAAGYRVSESGGTFRISR